MVKPSKPNSEDLVPMDHLKPADLAWSNVYKSTDKGESWTQTNHDTVNVSGKAPYSFNKIYIDPLNENNLYVISDNLPFSIDGGKTWDDIDWGDHKILKNIFGNYRTMWINPKDSRHMMFGKGLQIVGKVKFQLKIGYWLAYGTACTALLTSIIVDGCIQVTQFGYHMRIDQLKGERKKIEPIAEKGKAVYRYPWSPPIIISPHNNKTIYTGSQMLLQSKDRGDTWKEVSPDLTSNNTEKIAGKGHMMYCTITTISESPI